MAYPKRNSIKAKFSSFRYSQDQNFQAKPIRNLLFYAAIKLPIKSQSYYLKF